MKIARTPVFLMANLGAEVSRVASFHEKGDVESAHKALIRAQGIIDEIKKFPEMQQRLPEMEILSVTINDIISPQPVFSVSAMKLRDYFYPFALRLASL